MAQRKKKRVETRKVSIELRGPVLEEVRKFLVTGLYGNNLDAVAERFFFEGLEGHRERAQYNHLVNIDGFPGYVIERYAAKTGSTVEKVLEQVVNHWVSDHYAHLMGGGIGLQSPEWQAYLKRKNGKKKRR